MREPLYFGPKKDKEKWMSWLEELKHKINDDGSIDVQDVFIKDKTASVIPFQFRKVEKDFYYHTSNITSLKGSPKIVGRDFNCSMNNLTSLEGAPETVGGEFSCRINNLTSLEGSPEKIGKDFYCDMNSLTSLKGSPKIVKGNFICFENNIISLEGAPEYIGGHFQSDNFTDEDYREYIKFKGLREKLPELEGIF